MGLRTDCRVGWIGGEPTSCSNDWVLAVGCRTVDDDINEPWPDYRAHRQSTHIEPFEQRSRSILQCRETGIIVSVDRTRCPEETTEMTRLGLPLVLLASGRPRRQVPVGARIDSSIC